MAYSTIYYIFENKFSYDGFIAYRPNVSNSKKELSLARKLKIPVLCKGNDSVAFPDNYRLESEIKLSSWDKVKGSEKTGFFRISRNDKTEAVILLIKELMVEVSVPILPGFFQSLIRQSILGQTHTISSVGKTVCVQGKFKFNEGFLELDFEE